MEEVLNATKRKTTEDLNRAKKAKPSTEEVDLESIYTNKKIHDLHIVHKTKNAIYRQRKAYKVVFANIKKVAVVHYLESETCTLMHLPPSKKIVKKEDRASIKTADSIDEDVFTLQIQFIHDNKPFVPNEQKALTLYYIESPIEVFNSDVFCVFELNYSPKDLLPKNIRAETMNIALRFTLYNEFEVYEGDFEIIYKKTSNSSKQKRPADFSDSDAEQEEENLPEEGLYRDFDRDLASQEEDSQNEEDQDEISDRELINELCKKIGLKRSWTDDLDDTILAHRSAVDLVKKYIESSIPKDADPTVQVFQNAGFTESVSQEIADMNKIQEEEALYWGIRWVTNSSEELTSAQKVVLNKIDTKWKQVNFPHGEAEKELYSISEMNRQLTNSRDTILETFPVKPEKELWYHATSIGYALDIIQNGIDIAFGGVKMDFTHGSGFYVGNSLEKAIQWCNTSGQADAGILIFNVTEEQLQKCFITTCEGKENKNLWITIVRGHRTADPKIVRSYQSYPLIKGPVAKNRPKEGRYTPKPIENFLQIAIRKSEAAEEWSKSIVGLIHVKRASNHQLPNISQLNIAGRSSRTDEEPLPQNTDVEDEENAPIEDEKNAQDEDEENVSKEYKESTPENEENVSDEDMMEMEVDKGAKVDKEEKRKEQKNKKTKKEKKHKRKEKKNKKEKF